MIEPLRSEPFEVGDVQLLQYTVLQFAPQLPADNCADRGLDWMLILNGRDLEAVLSEYCAHYFDERLHRSRNLEPRASFGATTPSTSYRLERNTRLGGLFSEYRHVSVAA